MTWNDLGDVRGIPKRLAKHDWSGEEDEKKSFYIDWIFFPEDDGDGDQDDGGQKINKSFIYSPWLKAILYNFSTTHDVIHVIRYVCRYFYNAFLKQIIFSFGRCKMQFRQEKVLM